MSEHFNKLRPEQLEALAILAEECGETVQAIGKILRHGLASYNPDKPINNNRTLLIREIGDLRAAVELVERVGLVHEHELRTAHVDKIKRVAKYLHHITLPMERP